MKTTEYIDTDNNLVYTIYIGENKRENWEIIDNADNTDIWFHIENIPSCHIILKCNPGNKPCRKVIKRCAHLCKNYTNKCMKEKCNIIYTLVGCLEKTKYVGEVIASNCKTICV